MKTAIALLPLVALTLGIISTLSGFFLYYSGSIRKRYAAERDFEHLKRNQESIQQMLTMMDDSIQDLKTEVIRLTSRLDLK